MEPGQTSDGQPNQPSDGSAPLPVPGQSISPTPTSTPYQAPEIPSQAYDPSPQTTDQGASQADMQYPQPDPMSQQQQPMTPVSSAPNSSGGMGKKLLVLLLIVVILAAVGVGAYLTLYKKKAQNTLSTSTGSAASHSYATTEDAALAALRTNGSSLTESSLAAIKGTDLFYAVFRNAAEQPTVTTTTTSYWTPQLNGTPIVGASSHIAFVTQGGYDYKSGQFSFQSNLGGDVNKCVNGVEYTAFTDQPTTPWAKGAVGSDDCQAANTTATINDGINTGGLATTQAQNFVDAIRNIQGLVDVTKTSLVTEQGKPYVRFDITVDAHKDCYVHSVPSGVGCFGVAFNSLKLPKSWPYTAESSIVSGAQIAYFVDPVTQLPVYMQIAYTPVTATQGNWSNQQIEYSFAPLQTFQLTTGAIDPPQMSWSVIQL